MFDTLCDYRNSQDLLSSALVENRYSHPQYRSDDRNARDRHNIRHDAHELIWG